MATSEDKGDLEEKDEAGEAEDEATEKAEPAPKKDDDPKPARAAAKSAGKSKGSSTARAKPARTVPVKQGSSLGKSMILFVVIIGGLAAGFALLGREQPPAGAVKPKWTVGQTVDVDITLVKNDRTELSCASPEELGGKHCAFEAVNKPWSKGDNNDDAKLLKPYTTTDRIQFTAAGVWSQPALAGDKLPATRFSLKCKFKVEGTLKNLSVRWDHAGQWFPNNEWFAGAVSDCKIVP